MKKLLLLVLLVLTAVSAPAQSKLNPAARFMIQQAKMYPSRNAGENRISALVKLKTGQDISAIQDKDVEVLTTRGQFAIISIPLEKAENIVGNSAVSAMSFGEEAKPIMDAARPASSVNKLQQGISNGFAKNYRGNGILLGMMDQGLDPNHINFYNKELTANRIIGFNTILGTQGNLTTYDTPEKILNFGTENASSTHATHVAGIMSGAYNSEGRVAYVSSNSGVLVSTTRKNPYYGVAPEAELYPSVGALYNNNIVLAADLFAKKAKELGKPGVFNLSVGYVPGPHDGTSLINQALAEIGKDIIICVAAGNDGNANLSLQNDFAIVPEIKTILTSGNGSSWSGEIDTWSDDFNRFAMSFAMVDKSTGNITAKVDIPEIIPADGAFLLSNDNTQGATHNTTFTASYNSSSFVQAVSNVDEENNRFNVSIYLSLTPTDRCNVVPALIYSCSGKVKINSFAGGGMTFTDKIEKKTVSGYVAGNPDQSINNIACGENIIVVGAYISKIKWPVLSSQMIGYSNYSDVDVNEIADFTSYGNLPNGKKLPEICAPGMGIASSYSNYWVESTDVKDGGLVANSTTTVNAVNGATRNNPYGIEQGTSMAAPYVTGTVALLLEADPSLKVDKVKELLTKSAVKQTVGGTQAIQWGAGRLNADDAMRLVLGMPAEIGNVAADSERRFAVTIAGDAVEATVAGESSLTASLHSLAGAQVATGKATGETVRLSTGSLPKGVYVLTAVTPAGIKLTRTILLQ